MTIQDFIAKAIEGGWISQWGTMTHINLEPIKHEILLDPEAWKAVGKVEGWPDTSEIAQGLPVPMTTIGWLWNMHRMIDALAEGKSVEEYLETL